MKTTPNTAVQNDLATRPALCSKVDAHIHADTISYGNVEKQTVFWLDHHSSLVEFEAAKLKVLWEAAPDMLAALKTEQFALELIEAKDSPQDSVRLLESVGDYDSGWLDHDAVIENYKVKAALLRDAAIAKAEGR